jgi:hypothetical protein
MLEKLIRNIELNPGGSIFTRTRQYMAYANDMVVIGRSLQAVCEVIQQMEGTVLTIGLDINVEKTKYINTSRSGQQDAHTRTVDINGKDFKYLVSIITSDNKCVRDIKTSMAAGNRSYYALTKIMKSREISESTKLKIYRTIVRPIVMYGCEGWTMTEHMEEALRVWERNILRKVHGPKRDTNGWRIRTNKELQDQYRSAGIVTESIKVRRLEWAGRVVRMDDERMVKRVFFGNPGGRRKPG